MRCSSQEHRIALEPRPDKEKDKSSPYYPHLFTCRTPRVPTTQSSTGLAWYSRLSRAPFGTGVLNRPVENTGLSLQTHVLPTWAFLFFRAACSGTTALAARIVETVSVARGSQGDGNSHCGGVGV